MPDTPSLDPSTFDFDAWLEGVHRNRAIVTLYGREDLVAELDDLVAELAPLSEAKEEDGSIAEVGERRLVDTERRDELKARLKQLWDQYEASAIDVELTQMSSKAYDTLVEAVEKEHPEPAFDAPPTEQARVALLRQQAAAAAIVLASVTAIGPHGQPRTATTLTPATLDVLQERFGVRQYGELIGQARSLTLESTVDAPFSRRVSAALAESTTD